LLFNQTASRTNTAFDESEVIFPTVWIATERRICN
jgi:hypothetical protein